jgi:hypothetical protein
MRHPVSEVSESHPAEISRQAATIPVEQGPTAVIDRQPRNFVVMVAYQVLMRTGWIFKTESIIMPTVLDTLGMGAWLRGCLPMLNRIAQSLSPLLMARSIKILPKKKWAVAACTLVMAASFLLLAGVWSLYGGSGHWWVSIAFLSLYTVFFICNGVNQLSVSTLQGKLIRTRSRGRLLLVSNTVGAAIAIVCAWSLLPLWLSADVEQARFGLIFGFAGSCFAVAAAVALLLSEPSDDYDQPRASVVQIFGDVLAILKQDPNFRTLAVVAMLFSASLMLFPHYQALGRGERLKLDLSNLIWWVIVQNAGTALFSLLAGPLADRRGNRLVLRVVMLGLCGAPLTAIVVSHLGTQDNAAFVFPLVFLLVGLTPIGIKTFHNYTLELASPPEHPRYLSTLSVCASAPLLLSPAVGTLVDLVGFDAVFLGVTTLVLAGSLLTFRLREPRRRLASSEGSPPLADET